MRKGDARRQAILDIATKLFLQRGYDNTSIQDILDALGLSKGGFYHHFESKQSVLITICEAHIQDAIDTAEKAMPALPDPLTRLNAIYGMTGIFALNDPFFTATMIKAAYRNDGAAIRDAMLYTGKEHILPLFEKAVIDGTKEGVFRPVQPAPLMAKLLFLLGSDLFDEVASVISGKDSEAMSTAFEVIGAYRQSMETLLNAPFGSLEMLNLKKVDQVRKSLADPRLL